MSRPLNVDTKILTKEEVTEEPKTFLGELRRTTIGVLEGRDLKAFATIAEGRVTCPRKSLVEKSNTTTLESGLSFFKI